MTALRKVKSMAETYSGPSLRLNMQTLMQGLALAVMVAVLFGLWQMHDDNISMKAELGYLRQDVKDVKDTYRSYPTVSAMVSDHERRITKLEDAPFNTGKPRQ